MTRVFVYEYCTALGLGRVESDPAHSLFREGKAMRDAVADDFRRVPEVEVVTVESTPGVAEEWEFRAAAASSDFTLLIAPEFDGILLDRRAWAVDAGGRPLGPDAHAIRLTADKLALSDHWTANRVSTPATTRLTDWPPGRAPVVVKPRDGAGSTDTWLCRTAEEFARAATDPRLVAQDFVPGRPASVAFLVGPSQTVPLLATFQRLSPDGRFRYEGGELPIRPDLAARAVALGRKAIGCVPGLLGYVGVDLILGDAADGSADFAIEINPRLTTSYVGLRELADFNIAGAMLRVACGDAIPEPRWKSGRVRFRPDGVASHDPGGSFFG